MTIYGRPSLKRDSKLEKFMSSPKHHWSCVESSKNSPSAMDNFIDWTEKYILRVDKMSPLFQEVRNWGLISYKISKNRVGMKDSYIMFPLIPFERV